MIDLFRFLLVLLFFYFINYVIESVSMSVFIWLFIVDGEMEGDSIVVVVLVVFFEVFWFVVNDLISFFKVFICCFSLWLVVNILFFKVLICVVVFLKRNV